MQFGRREADRSAIDVGDPDLHIVVGEHIFHALRLTDAPVLPFESFEEFEPYSRQLRVEHRSPGAERKPHDTGCVTVAVWADDGFHGEGSLSHGRVSSGCRD
jgi:hypothetical protein